ncbi:MAG: hypothetical protein JW963_11480 [Anaerolineales bacterium]|nr:hypothetical protein [Anaerolineales bacterium]
MIDPAQDLQVAKGDRLVDIIQIWGYRLSLEDDPYVIATYLDKLLPTLLALLEDEQSDIGLRGIIAQTLAQFCAVLDADTEALAHAHDSRLNHALDLRAAVVRGFHLCFDHVTSVAGRAAVAGALVHLDDTPDARAQALALASWQGIVANLIMGGAHSMAMGLLEDGFTNELIKQKDHLTLLNLSEYDKQRICSEATEMFSGVNNGKFAVGFSTFLGANIPTLLAEMDWDEDITVNDLTALVDDVGLNLLFALLNGTIAATGNLDLDGYVADYVAGYLPGLGGYLDEFGLGLTGGVENGLLTITERLTDYEGLLHMGIN